MANFIMTNWYIKDKTPYVVIGTAGENNATSISIECDDNEIIENAEYFLDIGDTKNDIFNTQELTVKQQITPTGETTNILYLKPMRSFLGKEGVKLLQVRCEYIDNDEKVIKESNVFHAIVNKNTGFIYKFDIAIFQQYLNKVKELAEKVAQAIANLTLGDLKDTNIVDPTDGQIIKYDAETQKWVNGEGGGSGGSSNYNELSNKPRINNVVLSGNKTTSDLGINIPTKTSDLTNDNGFITIEDVPTKTSELTNDSNFVVDAHYVHTDNNYDTTAKNIVDGVTSALDGKVDKVSGKGLSTNDYTNADKAIVDGVTSALESKANITDLASVATSGDYDDLSDKPSINNVVLSGNKSTSDLGINVPTKTSDLTNDSNFVIDANYVHTDNNYTNTDKTIVDGVTNALASKANVADLATVATTGDYEDLSNKPSIPDVSDKMDKANPTGTGALSINRKSGTTIGANSIAVGNNVTAISGYSTAFGNNSEARGTASIAAGNFAITGYTGQAALGKYNDNKSTTLLEVGNGTDINNRSNAFEVYSDGSLSTDNGTTKVKLEDVLTDSDVTVTQTLSSGTKIGSISIDGISTDLFAPNGGSGSGDMLQSVYDPNGTVADAGGIVEYVGSMGGGIPHYSTMPTDAQLLAMTNKTVFETDGYWAQTDGHGGKYMITTNAWLVGGMLTITDGTTTKYLVALDNDGNALSTYVDPTRYGVRAIAGLNGNLTLANTYATENSDIISRLTNTHMNATIKFPKGYYVFESPLNFTNRQYSVAGVELPVTRTATLSLADYEVGTVLCFPFLTNGQTAIVTSGNSNIENLAIYGNKNTYHFVIDRTKLATAPNEVITETIAENEGTPIQCKAISKTGGGQINNVFIFNFYTGITCQGNTFIKNFYARHVHYGINCANDTKMEGIGGFNVHTLIRITGSLCSVLHERVDSCVHALEIVNGSSHTITDVDGDWCTDSLIAIGDGTTYGTVRGAIFDSIHGRCNTLKSYDSTQQTEPIDVRELADTDGYGVIRVYPRANFTDSRIVANMHGGGNPMDGTSNYLMPDILFTFASNDITELDNLTFVLAKGLYDIDEILRIVQTRTGFTARFDDASGVYFIEGNTVTTYENENEIENVATLRQTNLNIGDVVHTLGYRTVNDKGGATYQIRANSGSEVDNAGDIIVLTNGLVAEMVPENRVSMKAFGVISSNPADTSVQATNSTRLQNALNYADYRRVVLAIPSGAYYFSAAISITKLEGAVVEGDGKAELHYLGNGDFITINSMIDVIFRNVYFYSPNASGALLKILKGSTATTRNKIENCQFYGGFYGIDINSVNYMYIDKCNILGESTSRDAIDSAAINITNCEYIYITCTTAEKYNNGIAINGSQFIYITECDIPNFKGLWDSTNEVLTGGFGVKIFSDANVSIGSNTIYINNNSFLRTIRMIGVITLTNKKLSRIFAHENFYMTADCDWSDKGSVLYLDATNAQIQTIDVLDTYITDYSSRTRPTYTYKTITGGNCYDINVSDSNDAKPSTFDGTGIKNYISTSKLRSRVPNDFQVTENTTLASDVATFTNGELVINGGNWFYPFVYMNFSVACAITSVYSGSTGQELYFKARKPFNIVPSGNFCKNLNSTLTIQTGETLKLRKIGFPDAWIAEIADVNPSTDIDFATLLGGE